MNDYYLNRELIFPIILLIIKLFTQLISTHTIRKTLESLDSNKLFQKEMAPHPEKSLGAVALISLTTTYGFLGAYFG
jgi:hypothetical protein